MRAAWPPQNLPLSAESPAIVLNRLFISSVLLCGSFAQSAACNNDGIWNQEGDGLAFTVPPDFRETSWFKTVLGLGILATLGKVVAMIQRQKHRRRLERVERQRERQHERARITRDLHDDLGTCLTQISLPSAPANRKKTSAPQAKELSQQVRGPAREMVNALDKIVLAVNPKNNPLAGLVSYLGHFAEESFRPTGIRFRLNIPTQWRARPPAAESRHHPFRAFKVALDTAARHSAAAQVQVRVGDDGRRRL